MSILMQDGSEETELSSVYDILIRAGLDITICGIELENPHFAMFANPALAYVLTNRCSRNLKIGVDTESLPSDSENFSVVIIPGGAKGAKTLSESLPVQELLQRFEKQDKFIGAICAGSLAIKTAGLI